MSTLLALVALFSLTLADPPGDASGDGALVPPTSPVYANVAMFDLQAVELNISEAGQGVLRVTLGSLGPAASSEVEAEGEEVPEDEEAAERARELAATQFDVGGLLAVVDVYLSTGEEGASQTLRGPDMLMPTGHGWRYAVRLSSEGAWGVTYVGDNQQQVPATADADLPTLTYVPLNIERSGNQLSFVLPWQFEPSEHVGVFAVSGVHDPFSTDGWRGISSTPSPWAFSGGQQVSPVIDVLAPTAEAQAQALRTGVLPAPAGAGSSLPFSPWLLLMVGGVLVAVLGLVLRGRVPATKASGAASDEAAAYADASDDDDIDVLATLLPFETDVEVEEGYVGTVESAEEADDNAEALIEIGDEAVLAEPHVEIRLERKGNDDTAAALAAAVLMADTSDDNAEGMLDGSTPSEHVSAPVSLEDTGEQLVEIGDPEQPAEQTETNVQAVPDEPSVSDTSEVDLPGTDQQAADLNEILIDDLSQPGAMAVDPAPAPAPAIGAAKDIRAFSTSVEETYLDTSDNGTFGDDEEESFWHPRTRESTTKLKKTLVDRVIAAGEDSDSDAGPDNEDDSNDRGW